MQPEDYDITRGDELTHPDHGNVVVDSADTWPLLVCDPENNEEYEIFEFEYEETNE